MCYRRSVEPAAIPVSSVSLEDEEEIETSLSNDIVLDDQQPNSTTEEDVNDEEEQESISEEGTSNGGPILNNSDHQLSLNGDDTDVKPSSRRKSSFVLSIIQGRRDTATLQFVKAHRSFLKKWQRTSKNDTVTEVEEGDEETSSHTEEDTEQLLLATESSSHRETRVCSKTWWIRKFRNTKVSIRKSLKNLKFFIW